MKKLEYIGNYASWIKDEWIDYLLKNDGDHLPRAPESEKEDSFNTNDAPWKGFDPEHGLESWGRQDTSISYKSDILPWAPEKLPFDIECDGFEWFFLKVLPGHGQPVHRDYPFRNDVVIERFWMPLQDYKRGHIFFYEDTVLSNYRKGDVFKYNHPQDWHAGANMGHSIRLTCNLTTWKFI